MNGQTIHILKKKLSNKLLPFQIISQKLNTFFFYVDPADFDAPLLKQPLHFMPDKSAAPSWMTDIQSKIADASGFVIVSAEYNCAIPPALTNLLDYFPPADFRHKPASIVTYSMGEFISQFQSL